nr:hypothetical protein [uncultured Desulfuromonas sp.]
MKESITGRVGRIVSSSMNALMDAIENVAPEMVMEEAIREVDSALDDVRAELGKSLAQKHFASNAWPKAAKITATFQQKFNWQFLRIGMIWPRSPLHSKWILKRRFLFLKRLCSKQVPKRKS